MTRTNVSVSMDAKADLEELRFDMRAYSLDEVIRRLIASYKEQAAERAASRDHDPYDMGGD